MERLSEDVFFDKGNSAMFQFSPHNQGKEIGKVEQINGLDKKIKKWGANNMLPNDRDMILMDSNIVGSVIDTKRQILLGQGLVSYTETFENGNRTKKLQAINPKVAEWLETADFTEKYIDPAILDYYKNANIFAEITKTIKGDIVSVKDIDSRYIRAAEKINGTIPGYFICANWKDKPSEKNPATYVPAYNAEKKQLKYILHYGDNTFHDGYYFHPAYWGGHDWIELANAIPVFHKSNIENGYLIRYQIKYPADYFVNKQVYTEATTAESKAQCLKAADASKQEFINSMNNFLAGERNAGRAVFTSTSFDPFLKEWSGIEIIPLEVDLKDEALLQLFDATNKASISGQGIHPTLANIESAGKLSSGSEMRNAFMFYILTKTHRPRGIILKVLYHVLKNNGWHDPNIKYTFEDYNLAKLDDDKAGVKKMDEVKDDE